MDLEAIGKPISCHEGRLTRKGTRGHTTFNVNDYVLYTQAHFTVLQQSVIVAPYVTMHVQMLRSMNPKKSEDWIAREHRDNFGTWLRVEMMDKGQNVKLVDKNADDILLEILANGPSSTIHTYKSYDINGYTFYTRAQDNKSANQNSGVRIDAYNCDGNKVTNYGFIEEIWEIMEKI